MYTIRYFGEAHLWYSAPGRPQCMIRNPEKGSTEWYSTLGKIHCVVNYSGKGHCVVQHSGNGIHYIVYITVLQEESTVLREGVTVCRVVQYSGRDPLCVAAPWGVGNGAMVSRTIRSSVTHVRAAAAWPH